MSARVLHACIRGMLLIDLKEICNNVDETKTRTHNTHTHTRNCAATAMRHFDCLLLPFLPVPGSVELLNARIIGTQPVVSFDWSSDKEGKASLFRPMRSSVAPSNVLLWPAPLASG